MSSAYYEMLISRRSIRKFSDKAVEKDKINTILKSALLSPSSRSIRPWEFIAVTDNEILYKLSQSKEHGSQFLSGAPLGIVVIADPDLCDVWIEDSSIASINIQLAAQSLGLGSCWIQVRQRVHNSQKSSEDYIKEVLGIPENMCIESIIAIGYPDENRKPYDEKELLYDKVHYNSY